MIIQTTSKPPPDISSRYALIGHSYHGCSPIMPFLGGVAPQIRNCVTSFTAGGSSVVKHLSERYILSRAQWRVEPRRSPARSAV